ncbi:hypothetical protein pEaSNUABM11_00254 [Erwinia phage pEa_SNUABM_11]|nr:hypothetical protein pEaSNUABM11_00254 [Erwinia phage pEa_SNUABM_11]
MNPSDFNLTNRITKATSGVTDRVSQAQSAVNNVQNQAQNAVSRVTSTVDNVEKGITNAADTAKNAYSKAGEAYDKITDGASTLGSKIGNLFGGSDIASTGGTKTAGSGASGASPGNKIGGFSTDPKSVLPSLDPLKREVETPFKAANEVATGALDYLKPSKISSLLGSGFSTLTSLRDKGLAAVGTDFASVKSRVESTMKVAGQLAKLPGQVQSEINGYVSDFNSAKYQVTSIVDGAKTTFNSFKDLDDYLAIDNFISSFKTSSSDSYSTLDIGTTSAVIYGLSSSLASYNMPEKVVPLVDAVADPVAQAQLYRELAVQSSALGSLTSVEFYVGKLSDSDKVLISAEVIVNLLMNLQMETNPPYKTYGTRLLALFNTLDARWDKSAVVGQTDEVELYPYTFCNTNAIQALLTTEKRPFVCAAGYLSYDRADTMVNKFFDAA